VITKSKIGESLVEMATRIYGHATGVFWLLDDNQNLRIDTEFLTEIDVITRNDSVKLLEVGQVKYKALKLPKYPLLNRQSLFDVTIENQGTVLGIFDIAETNDFDGITEHVFVDQELEILESAASPRIRDILKKDMPVTTISEDDKSDGIGYMYLEKNFITR
jgi:hypothetical protein